MDWWKIAIIVIVVALVVTWLGPVAGLDLWAGAGQSALTQLATPAQNDAGYTATWSPASVLTDLLPTLFGDVWTSLGAPAFTIDQVIKGAFTALLVVVGAAIVLKYVFKITGG